MARRSSRASKTSRKIDFSQAVKYFKPDEEVEIVVKEASWEEGDKADYIAFVFSGTDDLEEAEGYHNASFSPKALERTRVLIEALGLEIPDDGDMEIDVKELVGLHCMAHTYEDEYRDNNGQKKTSVRFDDFWEIEKSKKAGKKDDDGKKGRGSKKKEPELLDRDEVEGMDRDDLVALIEEHDLDVDPKDRKLKKDDEALAAAVIEALEEKDLLEEAKPAKRGRGKDKDDGEGKGGRSSRGSRRSKKQQTWKEDDIADMSEEELDKVVEDSGIDLDLEEHKTLRKKKNALIDALEEADMLDKD